MTLFANVVDSSSDVSSSYSSSSDCNIRHNDNSKEEEEEEQVSAAVESTGTIRRYTTTVVAIADESSSTNSGTSYEYTIGNPSSPSTSCNNPKKQQQRPLHPLQVHTISVLNHTTTPPTESTKRYQTKMLLASLIEHFCRAYGDTPDANRKVFFLICQTLRSLGIIDAEFVDEMTSVRSSFQQAFHKLFYTAVQTVRNQDLVSFDDNLPRLIKPAKEEESDDEEYILTSESDTSNSSPSEDKKMEQQQPKTGRVMKKNNKDEIVVDYFSSSHNSANKTNTPSSNTSLLNQQGNFFHNLSVQNSRYNNDFVQLNLLGKGGFASAFRARNKLDGIDYAVKKIRLGNDIEEEGERETPYEKIFREIKNLARLEHVNVIRYYSSWLEYDESQHVPVDDDEYNSITPNRPTRRRRRKSSSSNFYYSEEEEEEEELSVFEGRDPTFDDDDDEDTSSLGGIYPAPSESGMSHIQFGSGSSSRSAAYPGNDSSSMSHNTTNASSSLLLNNNKKLSSSQKSGWTLFIQMQLCPTTLHDYIKFRNKQYATCNDPSLVDPKRNIEIFSQILHGTAYIHDQGLIHRDLKPSNIFLSLTYSDRKKARNKRSGSISSTSSSPHDDFDDEWVEEEAWVPKIGDFGLAAEVAMQDDANHENTAAGAVLIPSSGTSLPPSPVKSSSFSNSLTTTDDNGAMAVINMFNGNSHHGKLKRPKLRRTRTIGVGTRTYASPEQLAVPAQPYNDKTDIYSLGIILFELFQPFATGMERADSLDKLKQGVFPRGFLELYPKVSALIIWMMDAQPDHRPTAHQLLEFELFSSPLVQQQEATAAAAAVAADMNHQTMKQQLQTKSHVIEELQKRVDQVEAEKREMQKKMDEMQRQLDSLVLLQQNDSVKKCNSSIPLLFKKKKEVRWSTLNNTTE